jgi:hypothetical protein
VHCYEDRFRPYYGEDLSRVAGESRANAPRIIANLPARMTFLNSSGVEQAGTVILAGGEILLDAVRESVLYPGIQQLRAKYMDQGGVRVIVQTTGDLLTAAIARELRELGVWMISVSGIDGFHEGLEEESARAALQAKCTGILLGAGFQPEAPGAGLEGPFFHFFGATPDMWIGKLWPRGRAWRNGLSTAGIEDNFCNQWSGGLNFLNYGRAGSEVSIDPDGNVYPCCVKTKKALGNLLEQPLEAILASKRGNPMYEAISAGRPQEMGLKFGWSVERFLEKSRTTIPDGTPDGRAYENVCVGCDAFHDEVLGASPLVQLG